MTGLAGMFEFHMVAFAADLLPPFRFKMLDNLFTVHNFNRYTRILKKSRINLPASGMDRKAGRKKEKGP